MKDHFPIDAEARGKLRLLKKQLAEQYRRLNETYNPRTFEFAEQLAFKTGKGRDRARAKMIRTLGPGLHLERVWPNRMLWAILKPREGVFANSGMPDPSAHQDCITVNYVIAGDMGSLRTVGLCDGLWTIEFRDHALGRMFQRDRGCDPIKSMLDAHHAILAADTMLAHRRGGAEDVFHLRAGSGVFVCNFHVSDDRTSGFKTMLSVHARTFLHLDQLDGRTAVVAGKQPLGQSYLLPMPLRIIRAGEADKDGNCTLDVLTWHDSAEPTNLH